VRLRAIFLKVPPEASAATEEAIRQKAEKLRAEAVAKGNFAELARKYSQGPGAADGGELGPVASRDLMPQMRQALGALKPGQISPVLKIPGAYVFIQLLERSGESTIPLAQVKEQIRQHLEKQALERRYRKWMKELRDRTFVKIMD
jgi:peptidyl-prolyl cis-trans isomerase SurA